jgi:hypothetical protein
MGEYAVRRYRPGDEPGIARLQRHLWGSSVAASVGYFRWKYLDNPYIEDPIVYVATYGEEIIAMRGIFGTAWDVPGIGAQATAPCAADLVIDPDHRDPGLYQELGAAAFAEIDRLGYPYLLNLTANPENYVASILTQGWVAAGSHKILTRQTTAGRSGAGLISRVASSSRAYRLARRVLGVGRRVRERVDVDAFRTLDRQAARAGSRLPITMSDVVDSEELAAFVARSGPSVRLRHVRNVEYLSWRYRNPRSAYRVVTWGKGLEGYLVLQNTAGRRRVAIVDWEAEDRDVLKGLLEFAVQHGRFSNLRIWSACLPDFTVGLLQDNNFVDVFTEGTLRYAGRFLVRPMKAADGDADPFRSLDVAKMSNWDLRMIYSDAL